MKLLIVSGLSGSGKSIALDTLEDCGFYCIDNLPINLLEDFIEHVVLPDEIFYARTAISIDARNQSQSLMNNSNILELFKSKSIDCRVLFMQAEEATLLRRYNETRRRHPLSNLNLSLGEAIKHEKEMLQSLSNVADCIIDTTHTNYHQLREIIKQQIVEQDQHLLSVQFQSFGFKHGVPQDADFVFDVRSLPNPYWYPELRGLTGQNQAVIDFLQKDPKVQEMYADLSQFLERWLPRFEEDDRSYLTVAIGCTGGQHRSVYLVDTLAKKFCAYSMNIIVRHRDLH